MTWLVANWHALLPATWAHVTIVLASVICGAVVGAEREKRDKPAGLRTLIMVSLGSAIFTIVSFAFGTTTGDTGRVAAQIVTGIGFVGAGVILHGRTAVSGITTAATIWATAAVGIVVGVGYVAGGVALSVLIRIVLSGGHWLEQWILGEPRATQVEILMDRDHGKSRYRLERLLQEYRVHTAVDEVGREADDAVRFRLKCELPQRMRAEFLEELVNLASVREIREL